MAATRQDPASTPGGSTRPGDGAQTGDLWDVIEMQTAALARNLELLRRRGDFYASLDRASYLLLRTLESIGPADINTLAAAVGLDPSTAGRQVADLQHAGLIDRTPAPSDRRRSIITPTPDGVRRVDEVRCLRRENTQALLAGWTGEELRALGDSFTHFNRAVAEHYLGAAAPPTSATPAAPASGSATAPASGTAAAPASGERGATDPTPSTRRRSRKEPKGHGQ
jgi:DNA-binding MarR family transcriptional regulator